MNLLPAIMRTGVPIVYAVLIKLGLGHLLVALGMPADSSTAAVAYIAAVLLSVLLYVFIRELERLKPQIGVLLGWIGAPQYANTIDAVLDDSGPGIVDQVKSELAGVESRLVTAIEAKIAPAPAATVAAKPATKAAAAKKTTPPRKAAAKKTTAAAPKKA